MFDVKKLREIVANVAGVGIEAVADDCRISEDLGIRWPLPSTSPSRDETELIVAIEMEFDVEIKMERWAKVETFDGLSELVDELTKATP